MYTAFTVYISKYENMHNYFLETVMNVAISERTCTTKTGTVSYLKRIFKIISKTHCFPLFNIFFKL